MTPSFFHLSLRDSVLHPMEGWPGWSPWEHISGSSRLCFSAFPTTKGLYRKLVKRGATGESRALGHLINSGIWCCYVYSLCDSTGLVHPATGTMKGDGPCGAVVLTLNCASETQITGSCPGASDAVRLGWGDSEFLKSSRVMLAGLGTRL